MPDKLVRDEVGLLLRNEGMQVRQAADEELPGLLGEKLTEEVNELLDNPTDPEYYADVLLVLETLAERNQIRWDTIQVTGNNKRYRAGAFKDRLVWTY